MNVVGSVAAALFAAGGGWGQTAFEVASIKPVLPPMPEQILSGKARLGMKIDGARVDIGGATLASLILSAYRVKRYQISGPDWINGQNFDISCYLRHS